MKSQRKLHPLNDIKTLCDQLSMSPFSNNIKLVVSPLKFFAPKCSPYKKEQKIMFKMPIAIVCMPKDKKEAIFYKLFAATF